LQVAAAFAVPSSLGSGTEDDVKVAVQLCPGANVDEVSLWQWATEHMARFQVPSVIEIVDEIKKTPTGKVEKRDLKAEGGKHFDSQKR
jgi:acyl-CoA synthetase (AMP-forming)/AMP-acid ligase II